MFGYFYNKLIAKSIEKQNKFLNSLVVYLDNFLASLNQKFNENYLVNLVNYNLVMLSWITDNEQLRDEVDFIYEPNLDAYLKQKQYFVFNDKDHFTYILDLTNILDALNDLNPTSQILFLIKKFWFIDDANFLEKLFNTNKELWLVVYYTTTKTTNLTYYTKTDYTKLKFNHSLRFVINNLLLPFDTTMNEQNLIDFYLSMHHELKK